MKLAISNIAWAPGELDAALPLLVANDFTGLEVAPGLLFPDEPDPFVPNTSAIDLVATKLQRHGIALVSMQSLLFGVSDAQVFGNAEQRERFETAMIRALGFAERLEIPNLVFGSPGNRSYPPGTTRDEAWDRAGAVLARLGDLAARQGAVIAVEPNPAAYGTNFLCTVAEAADFVVALDHPAVTLNFDIGALTMNEEQAQAGAIVGRVGGKISHVHISAPGLGPAPFDTRDLANVAGDIIGSGYRGWYSIEMRPPAGGLAAVEDSLQRTAQVFTQLEVPGDA